jgi:hypothetical protein
MVFNLNKFIKESDRIYIKFGKMPLWKIYKSSEYKKLRYKNKDKVKKFELLDALAGGGYEGYKY